MYKVKKRSRDKERGGRTKSDKERECIGPIINLTS